jgi:hypothetical protein
MPNPLFSTYSQGENRVTASILAVFERLSFALVEQLLQSLFQEPETSLLTFRNQPVGPSSTPDARIRASFSYWIETKRQANAVQTSQLQRHLKALDDERNVDTQRLLVLTPDDRPPQSLAGIQDDRVVWANFQDLVKAIEEALDTDNEWLASDQHIPTERERELLRELVRFLLSEGLVSAAAQQVLVVAARTALPEYLRLEAYICQPHRSFQPCSHMAFYANGAIDRHVPAILGVVESISLAQESVLARRDLDRQARDRLLSLVRQLVKMRSPRIGDEQKVILLSTPNDPQTIRLPHDIQNDLTSESGRTIAFTQGQRYVPLDSLQAGPKTTSDLLADVAMR